MQQITGAQARQLAAVERVREINRTLDTLDENMLDLLRGINNHAEVHGWDGRLVADGLAKYEQMVARREELQEERRQLRQQPGSLAS